jgi:hypothetical protein
MNIKMITPDKAIQDHIEEQIEKNIQVLINILIHIGEECVAHAKALPSPPVFMRRAPHTPHYIDGELNLRSATGFAVVQNGSIVAKSDFEKLADTANEGPADGDLFLQQLAAQHSKGIALIISNGMYYSFWVAAKGCDVIDSAETLAERLSREIFKQFGFTK